MAIVHDNLATSGPPAVAVPPYVLDLHGQIDLTKRPPAGQIGPDAFAVLGLPQRLLIDETRIELRVRALIRELHPDRFHAQGPAAVEDAQWHTALVNDAWRKLRNFERRVHEVVALNAVAAEAPARLDAAFLLQMLDYNENLDGLLDLDVAGHPGGELSQLVDEIVELRNALGGELREAASAWDQADADAAPAERAESRIRLRTIAAKLSYIDRLRARVDTHAAAQAAAVALGE